MLEHVCKPLLSARNGREDRNSSSAQKMMNGGQKRADLCHLSRGFELWVGRSSDQIYSFRLGPMSSVEQDMSQAQPGSEVLPVRFPNISNSQNKLNACCPPFDPLRMSLRLPLSACSSRFLPRMFVPCTCPIGRACVPSM